VEQVGDELLKARMCTPTVARHLTVAHSVFRHAMRAHGLERDPASAELVDRPTVRCSGGFQPVDAEQLAALCRAAETPQDATLFLTAAMAGLRQERHAATTPVRPGSEGGEAAHITTPMRYIHHRPRG